jgi:hypothetical protein
VGAIQNIFVLWTRDLYVRAKSDAALSTWSDRYIYWNRDPTTSRHNTIIYICTARSPLTHQLAREPARRLYEPTYRVELHQVLEPTNWSPGHQLTGKPPTGCMSANCKAS